MEILQNVILAILIASAIIMTLAIIILPPKENSMGQAISGSEDLNLFGKKKTHGLVNVLERTVIVSATIFMVCAFVYNALIQYV